MKPLLTRHCCTKKLWNDWILCFSMAHVQSVVRASTFGYPQLIYYQTNNRHSLHPHISFDCAVGRFQALSLNNAICIADITLMLNWLSNSTVCIISQFPAVFNTVQSQLCITLYNVSCCNWWSPSMACLSDSWLHDAEMAEQVESCLGWIQGMCR